MADLTPLALSDRELKTVGEAAALLQPAQRDTFMRNCAALFASSGDLPHSIRGALGGFGIAVGRNVLKQGRSSSPTSSRRASARCSTAASCRRRHFQIC
jgi:hypothetical protein